MSKARGKVEEVDLLQITGLDGRVWQKDGSSTDNIGVVFSLRGEVVRIPGIQPLVEWSAFDRDDTGTPGTLPASPFYDELTGTLLPLMSIGSFNINGAVEIMLEYGGKVAVVRGNQVKVLAEGRRVARRPSEGTEFVQVGGAVLILNGVDQNLKWDGHVVSPLGILSSPGAPDIPGWTDARQAGSPLFSTDTTNTYPGTGIQKTQNDLDNNYTYKLTWTNSEGIESEPSPASLTISDSAITPSVSIPDRTFWVYVSGLSQQPPQPDIVGRRLWRAGSQGQLYYLIADLPGTLSDVYLDGTSVTYSSHIQLDAAGSNLPPPRAKFAIFMRGVTFYAGNPAAPRTLYHSRPDGRKGAVPQPGNTGQITTEDGSDVITALAVAADYGLVFTKRSIHMITLDKTSTPVITPISQTVGAVGNRAVASFEGSIYFFSHSGVFSFDGSSPRPLSSELNSMVEDLPEEFLKDTVAFVDSTKRRVCFSVCTGVKRGQLEGNENNEIWILHIDTGAISKAPFSVYDAMQYKGEVLVSFGRNMFGPIEDEDAGAGNLTVINDAPFRLTDLGMWGCLNSLAELEGYESFFETKWLTGKNPESDKTFHRVDLFYSQTGDYNIDLKWFVDWEDELVGTAPVSMHDGSATTWNSVISSSSPYHAGEIQPRKWDDSYPVVGGVQFVPTYAGKWDEKRVRSVRIDLGAASLQETAQSEGLTAKSIKLRVELNEPEDVVTVSSGDNGDVIYTLTGPDMRMIAQWKIIGIVLFYSDHGVRAEGTDVLDE